MLASSENMENCGASGLRLMRLTLEFSTKEELLFEWLAIVFFEVFYNKKSSLSVCQLTWHILIRQSINCSFLRTLASLSNQCNSFRLDINAFQLKGDHLVEGAMLYQRNALRLTFNRYFTRRSKLRVNIQSHRRAIKFYYATTYHDFVYIFVKYRYKIPNTKLLTHFGN